MSALPALAPLVPIPESAPRACGSPSSAGAGIGPRRPPGMHPPLTEEQQRLVDLVRALGRDRFAAARPPLRSRGVVPLRELRRPPRGRPARPHHPEAPRWPRRRLHDLHARVRRARPLVRRDGAHLQHARLQHAVVEPDGGRPADVRPTTARCTSAAARGSTTASSQDGALFAQPFSEPDSAAAAGQAPFGTTARKVEGGWRVNGVKHFASLAGAAHYYGLLCTEDRPGAAPSVKDTLYLAVPADAPGAADLRLVGSRSACAAPCRGRSASRTSSSATTTW